LPNEVNKSLAVFIAFLF